MGVTTRDEGSVRTIVLDRPRAFNALDPEHFRALHDAVVEALRDDGVRSIVLGAEGRVFCSGADLATFSQAHAAGTLSGLVHEMLPVFQRTVLHLAEGDKPTVAAVQGPAAGAGLDLALSCDHRVLGERATLSTAYLRVGLVPDGGAPHHLVRLLGAARATELLLVPDRLVSPEEAKAWGLATEVVKREEVLPRAVALARRLADGPRTAVRPTRRLLRDAAERDLGHALDAEAAAQRLAVSDPDVAEGLRAATERRAPRFQGAAGGESAGTDPAEGVSKEAGPALPGGDR
jgi:2-(1,2-epoxy-1,2-dihydrophenyl)acetyl-CoA isomerase